MIVVFDLDDTLYPERSFAESGFRAVAAKLWDELRIPQAQSLARMRAHVARSRDGVFDRVLIDLGAHTRARLKDCVVTYRLHPPRIRLHPSARRCLARLADRPRYVVTDGNPRIQRNKLRALGVERLVTRSFITHEHGLQHARPSAHCFELIRHRHDVAPDQVVCVGDDPRRDFVGVKRQGFATVRVRQGRLRNLRLSRTFEAHVEIASLEALTEDVLGRAAALAVSQMRGSLNSSSRGPRRALISSAV